MPRFRESNEFRPTLDAAAERLGISATAVEKDYWVSEVLRVLARDFAGDFIFKGGTSLPKGYRIVERFSEDIDILIIPAGRGRNTTGRLMKDMGHAAAAGIGGQAVKIGGSETGRHRSYQVSYPATREPTTLVRTSVLLEMGVRGGQDPHEPVTISCLLGGVLETAGTSLSEFADLEPFEVNVLHPGRTLLEKLILIHALTQQPETSAARRAEARSGRHFYDIYQLLDDDRVLDLLADRDQMMQASRASRRSIAPTSAGATTPHPARRMASRQARRSIPAATYRSVCASAMRPPCHNSTSGMAPCRRGTISAVALRTYIRCSSSRPPGRPATASRCAHQPSLGSERTYRTVGAPALCLATPSLSRKVTPE